MPGLSNEDICPPSFLVYNTSGLPGITIPGCGGFPRESLDATESGVLDSDCRRILSVGATEQEKNWLTLGTKVRNECIIITSVQDDTDTLGCSILCEVIEDVDSPEVMASVICVSMIKEGREHTLVYDHQNLDRARQQLCSKNKFCIVDIPASPKGNLKLSNQSLLVGAWNAARTRGSAKGSSSH